MIDGLSVKARWTLGLGACALGAAIYLASARKATPGVAPSASEPPPAPSASVARGPHLPRPPPMPPPRWPFEDPTPPAVVPVPAPEAAEDARIRALPPELRRAERLKQGHGPGGPARRSRYPADCRPASEAMRRVLPHYVPPVVRPLSPTPLELGHALVRSTQERDHLLPGESAILTLEVALDGQRAPFEVKDAALVREGAPGAGTVSLLAVTFRDDGVAPDRAANDGVVTARVGAPVRYSHHDGALGVRAVVSTAKETGEVTFPLVMTAAPPATFTGTIREVVEKGSLAFYAGVRIQTPGRYDFIGRVYDSQHRAMAVLITNGNLDSSSREVRLALCGKLLRDENIRGPWELRDVEGFFFAAAEGHPDRIPMLMWSGPHRTRVYPLETFTDGATDSPEAPPP